jgi:hypothetical protein
MSNIRPAGRADFEELLAQGEFSILDWDFLESAAHARGAKHVSVVVQNGGEKFLVPLVQRRVFGLYPLAESLPFGLYGGLQPDAQGLGPEAYVEMMEAVSRYLKVGIVFQNPFQQEIYARSRLVPVLETYAHMVHTKGQLYSEMLAKVFEYKMRKNIKRATQNKVEIRVGRTPELVRDFYGMYELSNLRWGRRKPRYDLRFFSRFAERPCFEVRVAYLENKPAAGLIMLRFRNYYFGWFGAINKEYGNSRANDLLHADLIKSSTESGISYVNFGSSRGIAGVQKFKESFGAVQHDYSVYFVGNPLARAALKRILSPPRTKPQAQAVAPPGQ